MNWTIKSKLVAIGALSVVALTILVAIAFISGNQVQEAATSAETRISQINVLREMHTDALAVSLAAMDALVDKDEGRIGETRSREISEHLTRLSGSGTKAAAYADTMQKKALARDIQAQIGVLTKAMREDLPRAIESRAAADVLAALDDRLDDAGGHLVGGIEKYQDLVREDLAEAFEAQRAAQSMSATGTTVTYLLALAVLLPLLLIVSRSIIGPVRAMTGVMGRLAGGDRAVEIPATDQTDEVGEMARAVLVFKENMIKGDEMAASQGREQDVREQRARLIESLTRDFDASATRVLKVVTAAAGDMEMAAQAMTGTADDTTQRATMVAAASEEAATNVETVAAAAEELHSSISEISRQVTESSRISQAAVEEARRADDMVKGLAEAAGKIGEVVSLINDIASQTNLLALNATIEAARAGDAGKGFAVVANEVKSLANQTARATDEISAQIHAVQNATGDAVEAIRNIGKTISQISEIAATIAAAVEEQGAATQEIARNVGQAAHGTQEVTSHIGGVTQAAAETGQTADHVLKAAGDLTHQADVLKREVDEFLHRIQTA